MTYIEKFEEIKKALADVETKKLDKDFAIEAEMTDEDCGGIFYIANINNAFAIEPYNYYDHTSKIIGNAKDILSALKNKASMTRLKNSGKIFIEGDESDIALVGSAFKSKAKESAKAVSKSVKKSAKKIADGAKKGAAATKEAVKKNAPIVKEEAQILASTVKETAVKNAPAVKAEAKKIASAVKEEVKEKAPAVKAEAKKIASAVKEEVKAAKKANDAKRAAKNK